MLLKSQFLNQRGYSAKTRQWLKIYFLCCEGNCTALHLHCTCLWSLSKLHCSVIRRNVLCSDVCKCFHWLRLLSLDCEQGVLDWFIYCCVTGQETETIIRELMLLLTSTRHFRDTFLWYHTSDHGWKIWTFCKDFCRLKINLQTKWFQMEIKAQFFPAI